jgi:hypothetical protein
MTEELDQSLCEACASTDFKWMGLHEKRPTLVYPHTTLSLTDLSQSAGRCYLCSRILDTFISRARRKSRERNLDLDRTSVTISHNEFFNTTKKTLMFYLHAHVQLAEIGGAISKKPIKFHFQKAISESMTVREICENFPDCEWPQVEHGVARWRPLLADLRLFGKWNNICNRFHEHQSCIPLARRSDLRRIRLIDVHLKSIVERSLDERTGQWNVSWVVLSYVWGSTNVNRLTSQTLSEFQTEGFFSPGSVPHTILDAIKVTESLGEQYLWVDSCCIIQDSNEDKREFVAQMDIVYGLASLTIVNAAGNHADHGLPGVRPETRHCVQKPLEVKGAMLVETLDPGEFGTRGLDHFLEGTPWNTRGWTLQEGLLSRKLLIFTAEQVYWECPKATWCEDSHWETSIEPSENQIFRHHLEHMESKDLWVPDLETFGSSYRHLVQIYSSRQLSFEGDFLNAFLGVSNCLEFSSGAKFLWGIPIKFLAQGLGWWRPSYLDDDVTFIKPGRCKMRYFQRECEVTFPSWSWVSCVGAHVFYIAYDYLNGPDAGIIFHVINQEGNIEELTRNTQFRTDRLQVPDDSQFQWRGTAKAVRTEDVPQTLLRSDIAPALLVFYTSSAKLDAAPGPSGGKPSLKYNGRVLDILWGQDPSFPPRETKVQIIIIGLDNHKSWELSELHLRALVVKNGDCGVLRRIGMIAIKEKDWTSIVERKWQLVFLA